MHTASDKNWLHHLYMQAPVAIAIFTGEEHYIEFANPKMLEVWEKPEEEVLNKPLFSVLPEVSKQGFEKILTTVLKTGKPFSGEEMPATLKRKGKLDLAYFNILYEPLKDDSDRIYGILQVAIEVTRPVKERMQAERREETLKMALEAAKMGTWHRDFIDKTFTCSSEFYKILGIAEENRVDWNLDKYLQLIIPEDRNMIIEKYGKRTPDRHLNFEARTVSPDGQLRWLQVKGQTEYDLAGNPIIMSGVVLDITEQKLVAERERELAVEQAARQESERQRKALDDLFNKAPAFICTLKGEKFVFDLVNKSYERIFPDRKLKGKPIVEAIPEIIDQPVHSYLKKVFKEGKEFIGKEVEFVIVSPETGIQEKRYFNFIYKALKDHTEIVNGILCVGHDVTDLINSKNKIEESEESLRMALEAGKMGAWEYDLQKGTSRLSLRHDQIFGYNVPLKKWGYKEFIQHVIPSERRKVKEEFRKARSAGSIDFRTRIKRTDGKNRWIEVKGQLFYQNEQLVRMAGVIMDITSGKQAEIKLRRLTDELAERNHELLALNKERNVNVAKLVSANKKLTEINTDLDNFIYTASHDLRAPVSNLEGLLNTFFSEVDVNEENKPMADMMFQSIERFKETIKDLTEITHAQKGDPEDRQVINIQQMLNEVLSGIKGLIKETSATINTDVRVSEINFSKKNFRSILYNFITNSIKYSSPERAPEINVSFYVKKGRIVLELTDNGLGIPEKNKGKIFGMFKRLHDHVEGTGVGLYIVKRMIDNAGGYIEVDSVEGAGTTFRVYFSSKAEVQ